MRHLSPIRHPYLFGGGISGALIAVAVAAFISMTAVVSQTQLPGGPSTVFPSAPGTLTISGGARELAAAGAAAERGHLRLARRLRLGAPASAGSARHPARHRPADRGRGRIHPVAGAAAARHAERAGNGPGNRPGNGTGPDPGAERPASGPRVPDARPGRERVAKGTAVPTFLSSSSARPPALPRLTRPMIPRPPSRRRPRPSPARDRATARRRAARSDRRSRRRGSARPRVDPPPPTDPLPDATQPGSGTVPERAHPTRQPIPPPRIPLRRRPIPPADRSPARRHAARSGHRPETPPVEAVTARLGPGPGSRRPRRGAAEPGGRAGGRGLVRGPVGGRRTPMRIVRLRAVPHMAAAKQAPMPSRRS